MKGHTNNPNGRPLKGSQKRKAITLHLQPSTIEIIREIAKSSGISQSDLIESIIENMVAEDTKNDTKLGMKLVYTSNYKQNENE